MKTTALPAPAVPYKLPVKRYLVNGIIHLTSEKFCIFVSVMSALTSYIGVLLDDTRLIGYGAVGFIIGFIPCATRKILRDSRQESLGLNNDKW